MNIPLKFKEIIDKDIELSGYLFMTLSQFEKIIKMSKFEFFSEYTNHGIEHIERVLMTAENLIGDSIKILTPRDITVLILSIVLHDLGMHITYEGFQTLLADQKNKKNTVPYFDQKFWHEEWSIYFEETKRWNENRLISTFGKIIEIKELSNDKDTLTEYDKKLIGEFIRRTHPRIAHEIALNGFPATNNGFIPFAVGMDDELRDITGLLARSHGMDIRSTLDYLKNKYGDYRTPYGVKIVYLMIVLRIADYLHITSDRAPYGALQLRTISSPFSVKEWNLHNSIKHTHRNHDDPETFFVQANPETSEMFLKIRRLLKDIQSELDLSWAIMGEVYGRIDELKEMKITVRRIRTNIEEKKFVEQVHYIPEEVTFDSDPALLKLLVAPLYGENPSYGVRELLQNALDACKEREHMELSKVQNQNFSYEPVVNISIESNDKNEYYFVINDNGIGMTKETIINFFFKAGASFRRSSKWIKTFSDKEGQSAVQRSGRFGVGVLASFLLGNEIEVSTRHINEHTGLKFKATVEEEQIELIKEAELEIGTSIKILLKKEALDALRKQVEEEYYYENGRTKCWYGWYLFDRPVVNIKIPNYWNPKGLEFYKKFYIKDIDGDDWHPIYPEKYNCVYWKYDQGKDFLLCNGIVITNSYRFLGHKAKSFPAFGYQNQPKLIVIDNTGNLPLSLDRNKLDCEGLPFEEELKKDICKDIIAQLLTAKDICCFKDYQAQINETQILHPALLWETKPNHGTHNRLGEGKLLFFEEGYALLHRYTLEVLSKDVITWFWLKNTKSIDFKSLQQSFSGAVFSKYALSEYRSILKSILYERTLVQNSYNIISKRIFIKKADYQNAFTETGNYRIKKEIKKIMNIESENRLWISVTLGSPEKSTIDFEFLSDYSNQIDLVIDHGISPRNIRRKNDNVEYKDYIQELLDCYIGRNVVIPYDLEERRKKYPKAFNELESYMHKYL